MILFTGQPAYSAGTIPVALAQQNDSNGRPMVGALLYLYQVGTVATPQNAFQDLSLLNALPWPVPTDANGRLPMFYLADGAVHARLTDSTGIVQFDYPTMLVVGPSSGSGGGGGGTIDPTSIATTGDVKFRPVAGGLTGWVRLNGQTIGSAASGASGRANADTQALFIYLYSVCVDANCPVSGGRTGNALNDFNANKTLTLLDLRGRSIFGQDDMGSASAGRLTGGTFTSGNATTEQSVGGAGSNTLVQGNLPNVIPTISFRSLGNAGTPTVVDAGSGAQSVTTPGAGSVFFSTQMSIIQGTISSLNSGAQTAVNGLPPFMLGSWYMKL